MVFSSNNDGNETYEERLRRNKKFLGKRTGIELGNLQAVDSQPYKKKLRCWQEDDQPESEVETAEEFIEPLLAPGYQRILLHYEVRQVEDLIITASQIEKYLQCLETAAGRLHRVKYFPSSELLTSNEFRNENYTVIVITIPMKEDGRTTLAVFDLRNFKCWRFFSKLNKKNPDFLEVKKILEKALSSTFYLLPKRKRDNIFPVRFEAFNDVFLMFLLCEKLFFTGHLAPIENLEIKAERKRVADIFDLINSPRWNKDWPPTLQNEVQADASGENLATDIEVINQTKKEVKTPVYSSLFFKLKDAVNIPVESYSDLTLDEICEILKNDKSEVNVFQALSSLYGLYAANLELFNEKFYDCIMPLIGELFKWKENVGDAFIFMLKKVFDAVYRLSAKTIWGCFNKLCEYILHGLQNEQSKFKVLSLHILQAHVFPLCFATMNKNLYYQYLDFLTRDCIIGKVNFDVIRAALITLPDFLQIYLRDNDSNPEEYVEVVIHNNQITSLFQNPQPEFDYTFGGTVFYDVPQSYPTNSKNGIALLGLCCFKFFSRIIVTENFELEDRYEYLANGLHFINLIIKRYVSDNEISKGRYGRAFIKLANDLGFMILASQNTILSPHLQTLHGI